MLEAGLLHAWVSLSIFSSSRIPAGSLSVARLSQPEQTEKPKRDGVVRVTLPGCLGLAVAGQVTRGAPRGCAGARLCFPGPAGVVP